ncbi:hypothetical protein RAMLITH_17110 [Ramlibacter sp. RBP-2]|uniref:Uncharacterized protein n=1 Tax=Ramlibacter lithotrophicus TaxID=2606681 RepID=A0A7X6DI25_9BURK|nr:hypothetical protein [Ramlibacter lithotrophicus]NKE67545.1 hypothetical protein [Ramlibacter lithotrophicus]
MENQCTHSIQLAPLDKRCRYWAKVVRRGSPLPLPSSVLGAESIPGLYLPRGDEELFPGDVLLEGESNHHRHQRGWTYWVTYVQEDGELVRFVSGFSEQKAAAKRQGLPPELLAGSGDLAGAVRVGHALRLGLDLCGA